MNLAERNVRDGYTLPTVTPQSDDPDGPWGPAISYWRKMKKWTQLRLAQEAEIEPKTLSKIVNGGDCTTTTLRKIAKALDVALDDVLILPQQRLPPSERQQIVAEVERDLLVRLAIKEHPTREELQQSTVNDILKFVNEHRAELNESPKKKTKRSRKAKMR